MKKFIVLAVIGIMLTGCGSDEKDDNNILSVTEETTVEETSENESEYEYENKDREESTQSESTTKKAEVDKKDTPKQVVDNPEVEQSSPVKNVSNDVFVEVSAAVRDNCNSNAKTGGDILRTAMQGKTYNKEETTYINTAGKLIDSYARLNKCRNMVYENNDVVNDEDIALLTSIEEGLGANVEIFLNTDTTDIMDSNFNYEKELDKLELSINNKMK